MPQQINGCVRRPAIEVGEFCQRVASESRAKTLRFCEVGDDATWYEGFQAKFFSGRWAFPDGQWHSGLEARQVVPRAGTCSSHRLKLKRKPTHWQESKHRQSSKERGHLAREGKGPGL
jgi:hypothetical protein